MCNGPTAARQNHRVRADVHQENESAEHKLRRPIEASRIEHRLDVVLDETAGIASLAAPHSKRILQRRQWANPAGILDQHSPYGRRDVQERNPGPSRRYESSQYDEEDETEMEYENDVR
jgi:hypothetical protein